MADAEYEPVALENVRMGFEIGVDRQIDLVAGPLHPLDERFFPTPPAAIEIGEVVGLGEAGVRPVEGDARSLAFLAAVKVRAAPNVVSVVGVGRELKDDLGIAAGLAGANHEKRLAGRPILTIPAQDDSIVARGPFAG